MQDLIFRFLLESGFPRGSILTDHKSDNTGQSYQPAFLIVDPESADTLAVIDVVESGTMEQLSSHALHTGRFAAKVGRHGVQSFVIQVDDENPVSSEQVRFFKLLAGKKMQQISSYAFPDLEALQVARKLKSKNQYPGAAVLDDDSGSRKETDRGAQVLYVLAILLVIMCVLDWSLMQIRGSGIFTLQQILLLISAAALLAIPILAQQIRRQR